MLADQMIFCGSELLVRGLVEACVMTLAGKPRRIPQPMRDKLLPFVGVSGNDAPKFGHVPKAC
jgi:acyl-CoA thioester hydrolase